MKIDLNSCFPESDKGVRGPLPKQSEFLRLAISKEPGSPRYIAYVGGIGCLAGDSLIQTEAGPKELTKLRLDDRVLTPFGAYSSSLAFPRGRDYLYTVQHEHGQFVAPGSHQVFCADYKYRSVLDLVENPSPIAFFENPLQTSSEPFQSKWPLNDQHLFDKALDFLGNCSTCYRQYGQLPLEVLNTCQETFPLLIDALGYNPFSELQDDLLELKQGSIRQDRLYALICKMGSSLRKADRPSYVVDQALTLSSAQSSQASPTLEQVQKKILPHLLSLLEPSTHISDVPFKISNIKHITVSDEKKWFWDISVEGPECYYSGGVLHHNSGKTLIGTITVLTWAIMYPGDYLISRQYMPELKATTLKTFLEICPPELIEEYRVADNIIRVKAVGGKISTIFFRQLEEYFKLKSMNLSGFLIDEGDQVSEEAFNMLQGRLRGGGIRKGIIVSNPNGHDWLYRWFYQKAHLATDWVKSQYHLVRAPSTENIHLPDDYLVSLMQSWSGDRIKKEIEGSFDAFEGAVYEEFNRAYHVIKPFKIPEEWPRYVGIDHGYRNPSAWIWTAIGPDGEVYVYREFYQPGWLIKEIVNGDKPTGKTGVVQMMKTRDGYERINRFFIDPSTRAKRGTNGQSDWDEYVRCLPEQFMLQKANNAVQLGIDRVKSYLKIHTKTGKPSLFIFDTCFNLIEEITQYKYPDLKPTQEGKKAENEKPVKVNDHALDALRYVIVTLPEPYEVPKSQWNSGGMSGVIKEEMRLIHNPPPKDPFGD